uniref:EBV BKRF4 homologue n=1 Tax=Leporid herpesvirus 1 TaxID=46017 RepID=Q69272_9GAMA|nr:EBV BKRF4 homologue [Leporid herpesvirus 1]
MPRGEKKVKKPVKKPQRSKIKQWPLPGAPRKKTTNYFDFPGPIRRGWGNVTEKMMKDIRAMSSGSDDVFEDTEKHCTPVKIKTCSPEFDPSSDSPGSDSSESGTSGVKGFLDLECKEEIDSSDLDSSELEQDSESSTDSSTSESSEQPKKTTVSDLEKCIELSSSTESMSENEGSTKSRSSKGRCHGKLRHDPSIVEISSSESEDEVERFIRRRAEAVLRRYKKKSGDESGDDLPSKLRQQARRELAACKPGKTESYKRDCLHHDEERKVKPRLQVSVIVISSDEDQADSIPVKEPVASGTETRHKSPPKTPPITEGENFVWPWK